jgi:uncharacterized protein with GYD domain
LSRHSFDGASREEYYPRADNVGGKSCPTFIAQGRFTKDAVKGMMQSPEDRTEPVGHLFEALGARLVSWYMTSGEYDWLLIVEAPSQDVVMQAAIVATGGGGVGDIKTCAAFTGQEARTMFEKANRVASQFKSAGQVAT